MLIRKHRIDRGWSQETLAELSGLSVRTIQRVERGGRASLDSITALAGAFDVSISELSTEAEMYQQNAIEPREEEILAQVRDIKGFYQHALSYALVNVVLAVANVIWYPGHFWALWCILGWGIGLASHGLAVFEVFTFFDADWEKRQVEKRLGK